MVSLTQVLQSTTDVPKIRAVSLIFGLLDVLPRKVSDWTIAFESIHKSDTEINLCSHKRRTYSSSNTRSKAMPRDPLINKVPLGRGFLARSCFRSSNDR